MDQEQSVDNSAGALRGLKWLSDGARLCAETPALWLAIALLYLAIGFLFNLLPFVGRLVMVLITPLFVAGAMTYAHERAQRVTDSGDSAESDINAPARSAVLSLFREAALRIVRGVSDIEHAKSVLIIGALALGGVVCIQILLQVLKVGTHTISVLIAGAETATGMVPSLLALFVVLIVEIAFAMALLYVVPFILFQHQPPLTALRSSLFACLGHVLPLATFMGVFVAGYFINLWSFGAIGDYGYIAYFVIGGIMLPWLIAGIYYSHRDLQAYP